MALETSPAARLRSELFQPTIDGEARLLVLIAAFSDLPEGVDGRTKLAKLDFLLRYPHYFVRAMSIRAPQEDHPLARASKADLETLETRMIRYRYGPWDPAYFTLIGRLVSRGLVVPVKTKYGIGLRATNAGAETVTKLTRHPSWKETQERAALLREHFNNKGKWLKDWIYENFPEVKGAKMGETL
jgi:hypothetical protein